jgi:hypothetical protein
MEKNRERKAERRGKVILLENLAPRKDVLGGSGKSPRPAISANITERTN